MYAIIETGGKQYRVEEGTILEVETLAGEVGAAFDFDRVLAVKKEDGLEIGQPYVNGATVHAKVLDHGKAKKIIVFKFKAKKNYQIGRAHV